MPVITTKLKQYNNADMEKINNIKESWWRHQMETFSALLALCAGNSSVTGEFPAQRPVTRSFDVFFICALNNGLSKQSRGWWFETLSRSLWRHGNVYDRHVWWCKQYTTALFSHALKIFWKHTHASVGLQRAKSGIYSVPILWNNYEW